jgi:hypothetical protein
MMSVESHGNPGPNTDLRIRWGMNELYGRHRAPLLRAGLALGILAGLLLTRPAFAEVLSVSGRGEAAVRAVSKKAVPYENRAALARAEDAAVKDALAQGVFRVYGDRAKLGDRADQILTDVAAHSANLIKDRETTRADIADGRAFAEVVLHVDGRALRDYLENSLGLSLVQEAEGQFRVFVLTYTVEGMDPSRTEPTVLREEITDNRKNVNSSNHSSSSADSSAKSEAASRQGSASASDKGSLSAKSEGSLDASQKSSGSAHAAGAVSGNASGPDGSLSLSEKGSASAEGKSSSAIKASAKESVDLSYDSKQAVAVDARSASASSSSKQRSQAGSSFTDTSTQYHKFVIYADTTKKGAGATNEIRAKLGELLKASGFVTAFADLPLQGRAMANEDELYRTILVEMRARPEIRREDYVAVALNRFTPLAGSPPRYTAQIVYRIIRLGDGQILIPDNVVTADSGDRASEDEARTVATELAMMKVDDVLPREVASALKQLQRSAKREAVAAATTYMIRIDNIGTPTATRQVKTALRSAGFAIDPQFRGEARTESISVTLNGKSGDEVVAALEPVVGPFDVLSLDSKAAVLKGR